MDKVTPKTVFERTEFFVKVCVPGFKPMHKHFSCRAEANAFASKFQPVPDFLSVTIYEANRL